jgi:acetamidase/formamidase
MFGCGHSMASAHVPGSPAVVEPGLRSRVHRLGRLEVLNQALRDFLSDMGVDAFPWLGFGVAASALGSLGRSMLGSVGEAHTAGGGRVHRIPSDDRTVRLGVFDSTLPNLIEVDSGDVVIYPDTWSHFLNRLQPGTNIEDLARLRAENPGKGPHSIIGPVGVHGAQPGDMLAIHFQRLEPVDWGATFVNPGALGTGTLADDFPDGQARYLSLDLATMSAEFLPGISVPLGPFQGTIGTAPRQGGVVSSVPPGQHAGNIDLRDLTEGSILYVPVWQVGAKLFTGDSHAAQGDGEVNNQALESAMREVRIQIVLHQQPGWAWPMAETASHWIVMGIHPDLNEAFRIATRNTIDFLERRCGLSRLDAYSLASIAVNFRVTQFVDQTRGVHAMIAKPLFSEQRRASITVV